MSYVESFARAMERARASVSYWDRKTLDHLQAAHDAEMRQCSKSEYHRGFEDSKATKSADQWQLDIERKAVAARLRKVVPSEQHGSHEMLSAICTAISKPVMGWTVGAGELLRDQLIALMGGDTDLAKTDAKVPDSGHVRECPQFPTATYDELGNERHRAVCELRKMRTDSGGFVKALANAVGVEWQAPRVARSLADVRDRLIYLLGADTILKEGGDGMARGDFERGTVPCDSVGARDVPEEAVVDECNFSTPESDMDAEDAGQNPAEIQEESSDHVSLGTQPVTDEQREYADDYCYRGHFSAFKSPWDNSAETSEDANGTASNDDGTCPITVQSPSITDELRKWVHDHIWQYAIDYVELYSIADRIDEQFERICSQHESVLQQTISETVDEHEREMAELRSDYEQAISDITGVERGEGSDLLMPVDVFLHVRDGLRHDVEMWRDRTEDMRMERDELQKSLVEVAEHVGVPHERDLSEYDDSTIANATIFCVDNLHRDIAERDTRLNSLLDLIRDAAKDYQTAVKVARRLQERTSELRRERDELLDKLQAISVLCEQDDG